MDQNEREMEHKEPLLDLPGKENFKALFKIDHDPKVCRRKVDEYHKYGKVDGILEKIKSNKNNGLNEENKQDIDWRIKTWGSNKKPEIVDQTYLEHVMRVFEDEMLRVLLAAAVISLVIGVSKDGIKTGWIEGVAIFFAVFIVVNISAYMNSKEEKEFNSLNKANRRKEVEVLRRTNTFQIDTEELVVGDIINYKVGDVTDVDAIMIENNGILVDESSLTGESKEIKKTMNLVENNITCGPLICSGCAIKKGSCKAVVVCVGASTVARQAEADVDNTKQTPLQEKLDNLKDEISNVAYYVSILIGILMVAKEVCIRLYYDLPIFDSTAIDVIVNAFIISISLLVVALPEGLPMAVTLSLVHSMKKMKQENNLVKYIDSSETMGNVNELCSDKTGTLTTGEMILARVFLTGTDYNLENSNPSSNSNSKVKGLNELRGKAMDFMNLNVLKNVTRYKKEERSNKYIVNGSMTDQGYMNFIDKFRMHEEIEKFEKYQVLKKDLIKVEFSSDEKFMAASIFSDNNKKYRILVKGAFDYFKSQGRFGSYLTNINVNKQESDLLDSFELETSNLDSKGYELFDNYIKNASENCLRSIFFGYKDIPKEDYDKIVQKHSNEPLLAFKEFLMKDITICGMMSFCDPPRDNIQTSIVKCLEAGVNLRMITGDDIRTAVSISYKIGILSENQYREICHQKPMPKELSNPTDEERKKYEKDMDEYFVYLDKLAANEKLFCLDGSTFNRLTGGLRPNPGFNKKEDISESNEPYELHDNTKFCRIVKNLKVIARCANDNKLLLVFGLKKNKNIVAVTGDGTNDAIALKNSDVGFAMGIRGTAVAKGAADIILLDDSFTSIITAIKYGRNVFDSIRKFVQFQLTTNIVAIFMVLLGGIILKDSPLNAIQMLWVNLIMDSFASLALATEPPSEGLLKRKPIDKSVGIVTEMMKINIISQAILQIVILLVIIFFGDLIFGVPSDRELTHFTWNENVGYHFTIFFNIFVFLQVFNSINSRKLLKKERNIFIGITNNPLYLVIQGGICIGQIIMVQLGGRALRTQPLTLKQHLICMAIGSISLVLGFIVKCLPFELEEDGGKLKKSTTIKSYGRGSTIHGPISMKSRV